MKEYKLVQTINKMKEIVDFFSENSELGRNLDYTEKLILETKEILVAYYGAFKYYIHKENVTGVLKICVYEEIR